MIITILSRLCVCVCGYIYWLIPFEHPAYKYVSLISVVDSCQEDQLYNQIKIMCSDEITTAQEESDDGNNKTPNTKGKLIKISSSSFFWFNELLIVVRSIIDGQMRR